MPFSIFISHRAEHRFLARLLKLRLEYLSSLDNLDPIECMEDIPGGAEWRKDDRQHGKSRLPDLRPYQQDMVCYRNLSSALEITSRALWFSVDSSPSFPMLAENEF